MEEQVTSKPKRPTFVTVLGILGFIGVGWGIVAGVIQMLAGMAYNAVSGAVSDVATENLSNVEGGSEAMTEFSNQMESANALLANQTTLGIVAIVASLICLLGIIWMWGLKKKGYYVYMVCEIAPVIATIALTGFSFAGAMAMVGMIFPILFIILWGLNLKHMS
jgi:hypothetical protein